MVAPLKPSPLNFPEIARPGNVARPGSVSGTGTGAVSGEGSTANFTEKLREVLNEANAPQVKAEKAADDYASGKQNDLHGTMITMAQADVSLRLAANVRNKAIEAYREVMRMGS